MSLSKGFAVKSRNHQWRGNEQLGTRRDGPLGYRPNDSLYEDLDAMMLTAPVSWSQSRALPLAPIGISALLESKVHALIDAMAAFAPSPAAQTTLNVWDESAVPSLASPAIGLS